MVIVEVSLILGVLAAAGIVLATWSLAPSPPDNADVVEGRLRAYEGKPVTSLHELEMQAPLRERVLLPMLLKVRVFVARRLPEKEREELQYRLIQAGRPGGMSAGDFVLLRYAMTLALCLLGALVGLLTHNPVLVAAGAVVGGVLGLLMPMLWVRQRVN